MDILIATIVRSKVVNAHVVIDGTIRQCPCRLYLNNPKKKQIEIQNEDKSYTLYDIESVDDLFKYSEAFSKAVQKYVK